MMKNFAGFVRELGDGALHQELTDELRDLVGQMHQVASVTGGSSKGQLTLTIKIAMKDGVFDVMGDVKVARPRKVRARTVMFRGADDSLSTSNPRQLDAFDRKERDETPSISRVS